MIAGGGAGCARGRGREGRGRGGRRARRGWRGGGSSRGSGTCGCWEMGIGALTLCVGGGEIFGCGRVSVGGAGGALCDGKLHLCVKGRATPGKEGFPSGGHGYLPNSIPPCQRAWATLLGCDPRHYIICWAYFIMHTPSFFTCP